jgi:hypothetical protein
LFPFDDVKKRLENMEAQLTGLANGYASTVEQLKGLATRNEVMGRTPDVNGLKNHMVDMHDSLLKAIDKVIPVVPETDIKLTLVNVHDSILKAIDKIPVAEGVSDGDDYKRGVQDGIRLAIEMGLKL